MPGLAVVDGARLICDQASCSFTILRVTNSSLTVEGKRLASKKDHKVGENIDPFSPFPPCAATGKPCAPALPGQWEGAEGGHLGMSCVPVICVSATLKCGKGGIITIGDPGQSKFEVAPPALGAAAGKEDDKGILERGLDFLVADDVRTVLDPNAPWYERALSGLSLAPGPTKLLKVAKFAKKGRKARRAQRQGTDVKGDNHTKNARPSSKQRHQKGQSRRIRDQQRANSTPKQKGAKAARRAGPKRIGRKNRKKQIREQQKNE